MAIEISRGNVFLLVAGMFFVFSFTQEKLRAVWLSLAVVFMILGFRGRSRTR